MPRVVLANKNITQLCASIKWSGDKSQAARKLELGIAVSPTDANLPVVSMSMGNMVLLYDDTGNELFRGYIFSRDKSNSNAEMDVMAYDGLVYLLKSKGTYNFKKLTAEAIAQKLASDFGIPAGSLAATGIPLSFVADSQSIYDILMQAYSGAGAQNGKTYLPIMDGGKLNVIEKGAYTASCVLSDGANVTDSDYEESIEDMVDRVRIYDENSNPVGTVQNDAWVKAYGVLQDTYSKENGVYAATAAKSKLVGISQTASVTAYPGNTACITGAAVCLQEPFTGLSGLFYIDTDTHTWENGQYSMELVVDMQNLMDAKALQKYYAETKTKKSAKSSSSKSSASLLGVLEAGGYTQ